VTNETYPIKKRIPTFKLGEEFRNFTELETLKFEGFTGFTSPTIQQMYWVLSYGYKYDYINEKSLEVLQNLPNLRKLSLTLSDIRSIDMSMFCKFNLTLLDLGINEIKQLSINANVHEQSKREVETPQNTNIPKTMMHILNYHKKYTQNIMQKYSHMLILFRNSLTSVTDNALNAFPRLRIWTFHIIILVTYLVEHLFICLD